VLKIQLFNSVIVVFFTYFNDMKFVFTGPESSGKTTLAEWASKQFGIPLVQEMSRIFFENRSNQYNKDDVREIGLLQRWEEIYVAKNVNHIICDTDILTVMIWQYEKYGLADEFFVQEWEKPNVDLYFHCTPDLPWEYDPLRENEHDRDRLFAIYTSYLIQFKKAFVVLSGTLAERQATISSTMQKKLNG